MKMLWATLYVKDMGESLKFYSEQLGLRIDHRLTQPDMDLVFLGEEHETLLELIEDKAILDVSHKGDFSIGFQIENGQEFIENLKDQGVKVLGGPINANPITKFWFVEGPDKEKVQLVQIKDEL
jgi:lactoylglutathione lyase